MEIGRYIRNGTVKETEWLEKVAGIFGSAEIARKDICAVPKQDGRSSRGKLLREYLGMEKEENAAYGMIVKHLFCHEDHFLHERILLEQKSLKECLDYLFGQAWKRACQGKCSCASEEEVQAAIWEPSKGWKHFQKLCGTGGRNKEREKSGIARTR